MPTLYVENVPKDLYEALRARARKNRSSIAAEVIAMLKDTVPTAAELKRRRRLLEEVHCNCNPLLHLEAVRSPPPRRWCARTANDEQIRRRRQRRREVGNARDH